MFSSLNNITFKYVFDSKILALSTLLLLVSWVVTLLMTFLPFWFELVLNPKDGTFGSMQQRQRTVINTGIFFMREDHFDNLASLNKYSNVDVVPKVLAFAQTCSVLSMTILSGCVVGACILMCRRFGSGSGTIFLAAGATVAAIFEILALVFCLILVLHSSCEPESNSNCAYEDNLVWQMIPMYTQMYRVEPHLTPYVKASWAFFIAIIGAILLIVAAIMLWIEALSTNGDISDIRYQQLRQTQDPHEGDIDCRDGKTKFRYADSPQFGLGAYGMQPVMSGPPQPYQTPGVSYAPQYAPQRQTGFRDEPQYEPQQTRFRDDRDTSYDSSSSIGGKREINL